MAPIRWTAYHVALATGKFGLAWSGLSIHAGLTGTIQEDSCLVPRWEIDLAAPGGYAAT